MALIDPDLSEAVTEAWNEMTEEVPSSFFLERVKDAMGLNSTSVYSYILQYRDGLYYGTSSHKPESPNDKLEKLSVVLFALGFPGKGGKYQGVLESIERMAASRGDTFTFPPPEDKRISCEHIKATYKEQNDSMPNSNEEKVALDAKESGKSGEVSAHDSITSLLAALNHKAGRHYTPLIDEGYIRDVIGTSKYHVSGLTLGISDLDGENYREYVFPQSTFNMERIKNMSFKNLQQFLEAVIGRKVRIAHHHKKTGGLSTVKMIAVDGSTTVYYREGRGEILKPFSLRAGMYTGL